MLTYKHDTVPVPYLFKKGLINIVYTTKYSSGNNLPLCWRATGNAVGTISLAKSCPSYYSCNNKEEAVPNKGLRG